MTKDDILDAAAQIFSQKGYHGASMQDIAFAVDLQKGSLYYHIPSKQEILFELLSKGLDILTDEVTAAIQEPVPADEKLRRAMRAYLGTLTDYQNLAAVLITEHRSLEPEYQKRHIPQRDRFERIWRDLILEGKMAGIFTCEHPSLSARAVLGVLNWTVTWFRNDGPMSSEYIANQFSELFLTGLLDRAGVVEAES